MVEAWVRPAVAAVSSKEINVLVASMPEAVSMPTVREFGLKLREVEELARRVGALEAKLSATESPKAA